jgi:hypothetical protein
MGAGRAMKPVEATKGAEPTPGHRRPARIDEHDRLLAKERAEEEREEGLDPTDAAARFIADAEAGNLFRGLRSPDARWRMAPPTEAQRRMLRGLGINPFSVTTRGQASDKIADAKKQRTNP